MSDSILIKVKEIIDEIKIKEESTLKGLGADSLDVAEILMYVEEEYGFMITDEEWTSTKTIKDIVGCVERNKDVFGKK